MKRFSNSTAPSYSLDHDDDLDEIVTTDDISYSNANSPDNNNSTSQGFRGNKGNINANNNNQRPRNNQQQESNNNNNNNNANTSNTHLRDNNEVYGKRHSLSSLANEIFKEDPIMSGAKELIDRFEAEYMKEQKGLADFHRDEDEEEIFSETNWLEEGAPKPHSNHVEDDHHKQPQQHSVPRRNTSGNRNNSSKNNNFTSNSPEHHMRMHDGGEHYDGHGEGINEDKKPSLSLQFKNKIQTVNKAVFHANLSNTDDPEKMRMLYMITKLQSEYKDSKEREKRAIDTAFTFSNLLIQQQNYMNTLRQKNGLLETELVEQKELVKELKASLHRANMNATHQKNTTSVIEQAIALADQMKATKEADERGLQKIVEQQRAEIETLSKIVQQMAELFSIASPPYGRYTSSPVMAQTPTTIHHVPPSSSIPSPMSSPSQQQQQAPVKQ